jgi:hypothetical protein
MRSKLHCMRHGLDAVKLLLQPGGTASVLEPLGPRFRAVELLDSQSPELKLSVSRRESGPTSGQ